ncbi:uncharacterized protein METZ01_LOCUS430586, partial [marine metagenome]
MLRILVLRLASDLIAYPCRGRLEICSRLPS